MRDKKKQLRQYLAEEDPALWDDMNQQIHLMGTELDLLLEDIHNSETTAEDCEKIREQILLQTQRYTDTIRKIEKRHKVHIDSKADSGLVPYDFENAPFDPAEVLAMRDGLLDIRINLKCDKGLLLEKIGGLIDQNKARTGTELFFLQYRVFFIKFDMYYTQQKMNKSNALERISEEFRDEFDIEIDVETFHRRYLPLLRKEKNIKSIRQLQKGDK